MYNNLTFGNSSGGYNVRSLNTALAREEAAATVFFTVPGPKMIWQFEERGYDIPLNFGGSNLANKPPHWEYMTVPERVHLYHVYKSIIQLRLSNTAVFNNTSFTYDFNSGLVKVFQIADPNAAGLKVTVVANMDVIAQTKTINFQAIGNWTNYISNGIGTGLNGVTGNNFALTATSQTVTLQPGEYHIYVSVSTCTTAAPTANSPVNYCQNAAATALQATGTNLLWYTTATGGTGSPLAPTPSTATIGTTTYYVSQTIGCESPRLPIVVNVTASTPPPTVNSPVNYCQNAVAVPLTATGTGLLWYTAATGGSGNATAPTPVTTTIGSTSYYVSQTQSCGESPRAVIVVNVSAVPAMPTVTSPVTYCQNSTAVPLTATGNNLLWYTTATGGTGSTTAPTPSTATAGSTVYYVSQSNTGCESPRAAITVNVNASPLLPTVTTPVTYCQNAVSAQLTATGTGLLWYTAATGGTGSAIAPTPSTATAGTTNYYVTQTANGCESQRAVIVVNVTGLPAVPVVITPVTYCQNSTAGALAATGTNLKWYTTATGGTGSTSAPTPTTTVAGNTTYYVSQSNNCGEGPRATINVIVTATPAAATGLNVTNINTNSVVLNWTSSAGNFYTVDYKGAVSGAWINAANGISGGSVAVTGLIPATLYDWRVSANCAATAVNNYATAQFTTKSHNNQIANLRDGYGIKISPNPVNGNAIIDYILSGNGRVSIEVFNPQGQRVQTLLNTSKINGQYQLVVTDQLDKLTKGVYFLWLTQNNKSNIVKFVKY